MPWLPLPDEWKNRVGETYIVRDQIEGPSYIAWNSGGDWLCNTHCPDTGNIDGEQKCLPKFYFVNPVPQNGKWE